MSVTDDNPMEIERKENAMRPIRQIIDDLPEVMTVPPALCHRRVEAIFWPLDEPMEAEQPVATADPDIRKFFGCFQDFPEREAQGEWERRDEMT